MREIFRDASVEREVVEVLNKMEETQVEQQQQEQEKK